MHFSSRHRGPILATAVFTASALLCGIHPPAAAAATWHSVDTVTRSGLASSLGTWNATPIAVAVAAASPNLVNRATAAGINWPSTPSWDLSAVDYDNDGDTDFSMSLHMRNAGELRRNNGDGTFTRVVPEMMPRPSPQGDLVDRHSCTWADFDRNGLSDSYCVAGRWATNRYKTEAINNELWMQTSVGRKTGL